MNELEELRQERNTMVRRIHSELLSKLTPARLYTLYKVGFDLLSEQKNYKIKQR